MAVSTLLWHVADIARFASGGMAIAPSADFAAGVAWLAGQLNAPVQMPEHDIAQRVNDFAAGVAWLAGQIGAPVQMPERDTLQRVALIEAWAEK